MLWTAPMAAGRAQGIVGPELVVLAAPRSDDPYYADMTGVIRAFHLRFARLLLEHGDEVLVLTDAAGRAPYAEALGPQRVLAEPMSDIWLRDFGTANPQRPVLFTYTPAGQGGGATGARDARYVQAAFTALARRAGIEYKATGLLNDGGNWVEDGEGMAVASTKFLRDNGLDAAAARRALRELTGAGQVAFIEADEQGGLEHADGVVSFLAPGVLLVNHYPEDPAYDRALVAALKEGLPGVAIHRMPTAHDTGATLDPRFGSACGLYANALVTPERVYLPQFGVAEDALALAVVRAATDKAVVPAPSGGVCGMGGGVRCLTMQLRGENAARLLRYAARQAAP